MRVRRREVAWLLLGGAAGALLTALILPQNASKADSASEPVVDPSTAAKQELAARDLPECGVARTSTRVVFRDRPSGDCPGAADAIRRCEDELEENRKFTNWLAEQPPTDFPAMKAVGLSDEELAFMARICELRIETPGPLTQNQIEVRGMAPDEVAAYAEALSEMEAETQRMYADAYFRAFGAPPEEGESFLTAMIAAKEPGDEGLRRRIAEERAGLREPPSDPARLSPFEQYFRASATRGERLEALLAKRIGRDRAREIHEMPEAGQHWPGGTGVHYRGCEDPPPE